MAKKKVADKGADGTGQIAKVGSVVVLLHADS